MNIKTRTTAQGTEYWDTEKKLVRFVPAGEKPDFEVQEETEDKEPDNDINLDDMDKEQLLAFAEENEIDIPGNISKEETIRNHIAETLEEE